MRPEYGDNTRRRDPQLLGMGGNRVAPILDVHAIELARRR